MTEAVLKAAEPFSSSSVRAKCNDLKEIDRSQIPCSPGLPTRKLRPKVFGSRFRLGLMPEQSSVLGSSTMAVLSAWPSRIPKSAGSFHRIDSRCRKKRSDECRRRAEIEERAFRVC